MTRHSRDDGDGYTNPGAKEDTGIFEPLWPNETRGDGKVRANNRRTGSSQGSGSFKRKVSCRQCGFIFDLGKTDHSGGSLDGNGAGGAVSQVSSTLTDKTGAAQTIVSGDQAYSKGSGCPLCFSKNGSIMGQDAVAAEPRPGIGF